MNFRKFLPLVLLALILFPALRAQSPVIPDGVMERLTATDRLIIGFKPATPFSERAQIVREMGKFHQITRETAQVFEGVYMLTARPGSNWTPKDFPILQQELLSYPQTDYVYPVLMTEKNDWFGVLNRVWVRLTDESELPRLEQFAHQNQVTYAGPNQLSPAWKLLTTDKNSLLNPLEVSLVLGKENWISSAEPDYLFQPIVTTSDPYFSYQWAIKNTGQSQQGGGTPGADMNVEAAWAFTTGSPSTIVALLDSGTDTNHVDLTGNLKPGFDGIGQGQQGYPNTNFPEDGHGTACAGIIAAKANNNVGTAGICYDCSVMPIRVFYYLQDSLLGIIPWSIPTWMVDGINHARLNGASLMSNSWGVPDALLFLFPGGTTIVEAAMEDAFTLGRNGLGIPMFFSSGNDGGSPIWPGRVKGAICVNATSMCDERKKPTSCDGENWEGNWKDSVDIGAPGVLIATADMTGAAGFTPTDINTSFNGTSAACPNAAGVMGLILSADPSISLKTARKYLETTCDKVGNYNYFKTKANGTWSNELGFGRVNAGNAVQAVSRDRSLREFGASLSLYPNPVQSTLNLDLEIAESADLKFSLLDLNGKIVWQNFPGKLGPGQHHLQWELPVQKLAPGMYIFRAEGPMGALGRKLIISN
ncbi:MAG: S8 family peptidase [Bacteroidia bacterium]|nr:S8 family peptidase [Bacteroidia bacterium]